VLEHDAQRHEISSAGSRISPSSCDESRLAAVRVMLCVAHHVTRRDARRRAALQGTAPRCNAEADQQWGIAALDRDGWDLVSDHHEHLLELQPKLRNTLGCKRRTAS
jgi:hypothetical protein